MCSCKHLRAINRVPNCRHLSFRYLRPPVQSSWKLFYWVPWACIPRWDVIRNFITLGWLSFDFVISLIISLYSSFTKKILDFYLQLIVSYFQPTNSLCTARPWLRHIGFVLVYGPLALKTWRQDLFLKFVLYSIAQMQVLSLAYKYIHLCVFAGTLPFWHSNLKKVP